MQGIQQLKMLACRLDAKRTPALSNFILREWGLEKRDPQRVPAQLLTWPAWFLGIKSISYTFLNSSFNL